MKCQLKYLVALKGTVSWEFLKYVLFYRRTSFRGRAVYFCYCTLFSATFFGKPTTVQIKCICTFICAACSLTSKLYFVRLVFAHLFPSRLCPKYSCLRVLFSNPFCIPAGLAPSHSFLFAISRSYSMFPKNYPWTFSYKILCLDMDRTIWSLRLIIHTIVLTLS
jgi:hypothetical protein